MLFTLLERLKVRFGSCPLALPLAPRYPHKNTLSGQNRLTTGVKAMLSLRNAINSYCRDCELRPNEGGGWKQQVAACPVKKCHLYPVRPLPRGALLGD